ncbi:MAG: hypothetical protein JNK82_03505 [Myxococcaceae bacterium]|nr:hypothetical protein [Myxococcaceae bacterium]
MHVRLGVGTLAVLLCACSGGSGGGTAGGGSGNAGGSGATAGGTASASGPFLIRRDVNSGSARLVVDGQGVTHLVAAPGAIDAPGGAKVTYGRCASGCESASGWSFVDIGDGALADQTALALGPNGALHAAYLVQGSVVLSTCTSSCLTAASWSLDPLSAPMDQQWRGFPRGRTFVVDAMGRQRLLIRGTVGGSNALLLLGNDGAGWGAGPLFNGQYEAATLTLRGATGVAMLGVPSIANGYSYAECTTACALPMSWAATPAVLPGAAYEVALTSDASGRLHAGILTGSSLSYATCSQGCAMGASWSTTNLGADTSALGGVDLAVSSAGAVGLVSSTVTSETQSVTFRSCSGNCTASGSWSSLPAIEPSSLTAPFPTQSPVNCNGESSLRVWSLGVTPRVVPRGSAWLVAYDATEYARCLSTTTGTFTGGDRFVRVHGLP